MAVIDILPGVKVEVTVKGGALKEYEDPDIEEEERTVTRYIEAVSGQVFEISAIVLPNFKFKGNRISFQYFVDSTRIENISIKKNERDRNAISEGCDPGDGQIRKYRFATLETCRRGTVSHNIASTLTITQ
jgi:hypothetical protein